MPNYPTPPSFLADIRDLKNRVAILEAQMANRTGPGTDTGAPAYDGNAIWNGAMESGMTGWARVYAAVGSLGTTVPEVSDPLDGLVSLRENESASSATRIFWLSNSTTAAPLVGDAVFNTAPGDVWRLTCAIRSNIAVPDAKLYASVGDTAANVYGLPGFTNTTWLQAAALPLTAGGITTLTGNITVPASRSFIGLHVTAAETPPGVNWSWWLDDVTLQRKLN